MSSEATSSPVSASTLAYLIRWPVLRLIWLKLTFSVSDVAGNRATGQVTSERRRKPFQLARGAMGYSETQQTTRRYHLNTRFQSERAGNLSTKLTWKGDLSGVARWQTIEPGTSSPIVRWLCCSRGQGVAITKEARPHGNERAPPDRRNTDRSTPSGIRAVRARVTRSLGRACDTHFGRGLVCVLPDLATPTECTAASQRPDEPDLRHPRHSRPLRSAQ